MITVQRHRTQIHPKLRVWTAAIVRLEQALHDAGPDEICCEGLSSRQCVVLRELVESEGARLSDLASIAGVTPSAMTRMLEKLERQALIRRVRGRLSDGREAMVAITDRGRDVRWRIDELMAERTKAILSSIPTRERGGVLRALRLLNKAMQGPGCCP